jgi:hypothetical protein
MPDDLQKYGRQPQRNENGRLPIFFLNQRQHKFLDTGRLPQFFRDGRQPHFFN